MYSFLKRVPWGIGERIRLRNDSRSKRVAAQNNVCQ